MALGNSVHVQNHLFKAIALNFIKNLAGCLGLTHPRFNVWWANAWELISEWARQRLRGLEPTYTAPLNEPEKSGGANRLALTEKNCQACIR